MPEPNPTILAAAAARPRPEFPAGVPMASYGMNDVKNGMKILVNGDPAIIVDTEYVKPGKGQAFTRVKYRMIKSGRVQEVTMKARSEEHTYELQSLMRISYAAFCLKKKN